MGGASLSLCMLEHPDRGDVHDGRCCASDCALPAGCLDIDDAQKIRGQAECPTEACLHMSP
eukprot:11193682-Alexandrium_andersonii.AAC.1